MEKYNELVKACQKIADVNYSIAILSWDKEVNLPSKGAAFRSQQIATLSGISHELSTDKAIGQLLSELEKEKAQLNPQQQKNVSLCYKEHQKQMKYTTDFVVKKSEAISKTYHSWLKAREANDFSVYKDALKEMVQIVREETEILGYQGHPYDALLDLYEPGCTVKELDVLFSDVKKKLVDFSKKIKAADQVNDDFLFKNYDHGKQWNYGLKVLKNMGYDFDAGRQDISHHPFTTNFSPQDVRVTTRIHEDNFGSMTWSCIHEGGHALYEQGLNPKEYGMPLGSFISLGIHESQSRMWENNVGRSLPYWRAHYAELKETFKENLADIDLNTFYKGINKVAPNLIRTESDELFYHFHVLIRYEIEKALIEGKIEVEDLDKIWNEKYKSYMGIDVPSDNLGVLQDIHWAHGSIGYFPTYSLGSFYAAQFFEQAKKDIPGLVDQIESGDNSNLLAWLRENIHQYGQFYTAEELCVKVTGEKLNFQYFMDYVEEKYGEIYIGKVTA